MLLSAAARLSSAHQLATGWQTPAHLFSPRPLSFFTLTLVYPAWLLLSTRSHSVFFFVNMFHQLCHQDAAAKPPA
jgi:hypothetical protein